MSRKRYTPPLLAERYPLHIFAAIIDCGLVMAAAVFAFHWRFDSWDIAPFYAVTGLITALVGVLCQILVNSYGSWRGRNLSRQLRHVYFGWMLAFALLFGIATFLKVTSFYSRVWLVAVIIYTLTLVTAFRVAVYLLLRYVRSKGRNLKRVLIVTGAESEHPFQKRTTSLQDAGYSITQEVSWDPEQNWMQRLVQATQASQVHEVWVCLPLRDGDVIKEILHCLRHLTVDVRYIPKLDDMPLLNHRLSKIDNIYAIDISLTPMEGSARIIKRLEDLIIGSLISILMLPICIGIALAIKATSKGPVIFKQYRTGINGRRFKVYKFRSMEVHNEADGQVTQAKFGDPRVTKLGAFLRRTSLDELPQFYNVLQGRMSIVGPRPHALAHNEHYKDLIESYMKRHKVKPGITGWAQVNGYRGETDTIDKMENRIRYDLWYINNWSLWLDLKIIFLTIFKGFLNHKP